MLLAVTSQNGRQELTPVCGGVPRVTGRVVCALVVLVLAHFLQLQLGEAFMDAFMRDAGLETRGELAFYFNSRQEAEQEAGLVVADAWAAARAECRRGLGVKVRDLYERQQPPTCPSLRQTSNLARVEAKVVQQDRPARVPGAASATQKSSAAPLSESNAKHRPLLVEVLQKASKFAKQLQGAEVSP